MTAQTQPHNTTDKNQRVAGVVGWPVSHSLSPKLHNYWLREHNIPGKYVGLPVEPQRLKDTLSTFPLLGLKGVNLTLPHKELVMPYLSGASAEAQIIGAANTLTFDADGSMHGYNTDAYGFIENIRSHLPERKGKAVILGAGGAARAVAYALANEHFSEIIITNRTQKKAEALADQFDLEVTPWDKRHVALADASVLVNTTSLGMTGQGPLELNLSALPQQALVTDIVYAPLMTPLLVAAKSRGNTVVDGLGMLLHQAVPAFELWFGISPKVTQALRKHVLEETV